MIELRYIHVNGVSINHSSLDLALSDLEKLIELNAEKYICFLEANLLSRSMMDQQVRDVINRAAIVYPDGVSVAKIATWKSGIPFERVSGPSFLLKACEYGVTHQWRHFFYGGGEGVAEKLAESLRKKIPGVLIAGTYSPPFRALTEEETKEVKRKIEESHADLLWVGLGGPKQEFWMSAHQGKIHVPVMLGVGAAFDFHSGNCPWAPRIIRKMGLEWLWRMISGGRKTFVRNVKCVPRTFAVLMTTFILYKILRKHKTKLQTNHVV